MKEWEWDLKKAQELAALEKWLNDFPLGKKKIRQGGKTLERKIRFGAYEFINISYDSPMAIKISFTLTFESKHKTKKEKHHD